MVVKTLTITELLSLSTVMMMMMMSRSCEGHTKVGVEGRRSGEWNADTDVCLNGTQTELLMSTI